MTSSESRGERWNRLPFHVRLPLALAIWTCSALAGYYFADLVAGVVGL